MAHGSPKHRRRMKSLSTLSCRLALAVVVTVTLWCVPATAQQLAPSPLATAAEGQWLPDPAQWMAGPRVEAAPPIALRLESERAPFPRVFGGAVLGLAAGAAVGGLATAIIDNVLPLYLAVPVGAGIGAHLANRKQGNLPLAIGVTFPVGVVVPFALMGGIPQGDDLLLFGAGSVLILAGTPALVEWWSAGW
jgi:hypothetical protein